MSGGSNTEVIGRRTLRAIKLWKADKICLSRVLRIMNKERMQLYGLRTRLLDDLCMVYLDKISWAKDMQELREWRESQQGE